MGHLARSPALFAALALTFNFESIHYLYPSASHKNNFDSKLTHATHAAKTYQPLHA